MGDQLQSFQIIGLLPIILCPVILDPCGGLIAPIAVDDVD